MDEEKTMLNNSEHDNIMIKVLPVGVEAPDYCKGRNLHKSHRKNAPKYEEVEEMIELEDNISEEVTTTQEVTLTIECFNGSITVSGNLMKVNEVMQWLSRLGLESSKDIKIVDDAFNISGDYNDGNYRYSRGDFMHKDPARCFGLVEVEPIEDGGRVWRDFADFDVNATFNLS